MALETTLNKNQILHLLQDHAGQVREFGMSRLYLFGTIVRGEETNNSDIDILVEFKEGKKIITILSN